MPRNPFLSRRLVEDPRQFFGRRQEARRIVDLLGAELPQSFFVVGERRIGKTSLLKFVSHPQGGPAEFAELLSRPPDHYLFVYIDLELLDPDGGALDACIVFFRLLFSRLNQVVQERLSQPSSPALELIFGENYVSFKGARVSVSQQELRLMKCLYMNAGQVCGRQQIYQHVWGHNAYSDAKTASINIAVQRLREKLKAHWGEELSIDAERGKGYRLIL